MNQLQFLLLLLLSTSSFASTFQSEIARVSLARFSTEPDLVFLMKDGLVAKLFPGQMKTLVLLAEGSANHQVFEIELDSNRVILSAKAVGVAPLDREEAISLVRTSYLPTVLPDMDAATEIFDELNSRWRSRAQCYNKADVCAYEEYQKRNLNSMKVFLFFTDQYIQNYNWAWWFHVSPFVLVNEGGEVTENVIDYTFMKAPTKMHEWTNYFIHSEVECPIAKKYSDYDNHQWESDCYVMKVPMYYWEPLDLENLEKAGVEKTSFIQSDVDTAYWQGF